MDSGDTHLKFPEMTISEEREFKLKALFFRKAHEHLGLDAQGVGELDLALGVDTLLETYEGSTVPLVNANLYDKDTGERLFKPFVIVERQGLKVAFTGILSESGSPLTPSVQSRVEVKDPKTELTKVLAAIDAVGGVDLKVLLSQLGKDGEMRIAREVPGIDLIVSGSDDVFYAPIESNKVPLVCAGRRGKMLGRIDLWYNSKGKTGAEEYIDASRARRKSLSDFPLRLAYSNRIEPLRKDLRFDQEIEDWIEEYKDKIHNLPPLDEDGEEIVDDEDDAPPAHQFWGSETCSKCHVTQAAWWQKTTHSTAFSTLEKIRMEKSNDCIGCHSVGFKEPGGFSEPANVGFHKNVGCESCHGRGDFHGQPDKFNQAPRSEATCLKCHTPERDPNWDTSKIDLLACPTLDQAKVGQRLEDQILDQLMAERLVVQKKAMKARGVDPDASQPFDLEAHTKGALKDGE